MGRHVSSADGRSEVICLFDRYYASIRSTSTHSKIATVLQFIFAYKKQFVVSRARPEWLTSPPTSLIICVLNAVLFSIF